jgi:exonuclease III
MAFRKKRDRLLQYDPDVLVIQECENPDKNGEWSAFSDWLWIGDNEHKGLGVFVRNDRSLTPAPVTGCGGRFSLPVTTEGSLDVLGLWAMNDEQRPKRRYIGQVYRTLRAYDEWIDENTVVAGDFNWNVVWAESPKRPLCGDFRDTVGLLHDHNLRSSYHTLTGTAFGEETTPTFFMHKKREKEYHTDYLFAEADTLDSGATCTVGTYDEWIDASDHVPVVVDL